ncbi:MAG: substrate-binding periplasmic protein [Dongiaceae bacterium]
MKKYALTFLLILCWVLPAHAEIAQNKIYERVMRTKIIQCGYSDWAPFIVTDPNTKQPSGIMKDIMDEIGKRLGVRVEWTASLGWGEIVEAANSGKIDLFCNTVWTDKVQLQNMSLSRPLFYTPTYAYARINDGRFDNNYEAINDPKITIVGIDGDTSYVTMQDHFPKAKMLALPNMNGIADQLLSVIAKKGDVTLGDPSAFEDFTLKNPGKIKQIKGKPLFIMNEVLVTRAGEQQLINVIDSILYSLINEGFIEKIFKKYKINSSFAPKPDFDLPAMYKN